MRSSIHMIAMHSFKYPVENEIKPNQIKCEDRRSLVIYEEKLLEMENESINECALMKLKRKLSLRSFKWLHIIEIFELWLNLYDFC